MAESNTCHRGLETHGEQAKDLLLQEQGARPSP